MTAKDSKIEHPTISLKSASISKGTIPATFTCDGKDSVPPLEWGKVPPRTRELALFVVGLKPTSKPHRYHISVEWALAGVKPSLHKLSGGHLPADTHPGRTSRGTTSYSICPAQGKKSYYQFLVYAVPPKAKVPARYDGSELLRILIKPHGKVAATGVGDFIASYTRQ